MREYNANRIYEYYPYELFYIFLDRSIFIDGEYERVKSKALYACEECSEEKDRQRLGL